MEWEHHSNMWFCVSNVQICCALISSSTIGNKSRVRLLDFAAREKNIRNFQSQGVHKFALFDIGGNPAWGLSELCRAKAGFLRKVFEVFELLEHRMS
jgi:hypothetical protein